MFSVTPGALAAFGWTDRVLALFSEVDDQTVEPARVVRVERSTCAAVFGDRSERLLHAAVLPAVGDWIAVRAESVHAVLPRWSVLSRADPSGSSVQVLAANLDLVVITAPADRLSPARVERELAVAWESGAQPLVALTKCDLADESVERSLAERLVGAEVLATSAATGRGIEDLRQRLRPARTAVLLGPSGAGKSTLANALLGTDLLATGAVRHADQRGRHTTTSRQLVTVPGGGVLIDTPGLRSLGLAGEVPVELAFPDIDTLADGCRFSDCRHQTEPGCAVVAAASNGELDQDRLVSFRKLQREAAAEARRTDPLLRQAELSIWKARVKSARINDKRRGR
ncbi:MAG TPA: ribosome small subunit-dependent GTPase A [Acidimicrobiales bacterium]|nr:ribosome small subunit-dependent GTPase A [Acidimicrobiales bacterium]